jgi:hypothetical protein
LGGSWLNLAPPHLPPTNRLEGVPADSPPPSLSLSNSAFIIKMPIMFGRPWISYNPRIDPWQKIDKTSTRHILIPLVWWIFPSDVYTCLS